MGKRSNFERRERDFYPTPYEAVIPLLPHLKPMTAFDEPCCGDGALVQHLARHGHIVRVASDINGGIDALKLATCCGDCFITNPPWSRDILHPMIWHLSSIAPTWLLFDADWAHTKQSAKLLQRCTHIVSVGRVKWFPGTKMTGKDNAAWYRFVTVSAPQTQFIGRTA